MIPLNLPSSFLAISTPVYYFHLNYNQLPSHKALALEGGKTPPNSQQNCQEISRVIQNLQETITQLEMLLEDPTLPAKQREQVKQKIRQYREDLEKAKKDRERHNCLFVPPVELSLTPIPPAS
jgi:hypothetical protein